MDEHKEINEYTFLAFDIFMLTLSKIKINYFRANNLSYIRNIKHIKLTNPLHIFTKSDYCNQVGIHFRFNSLFLL